jgi:hypothetical protein
MTSIKDLQNIIDRMKNGGMPVADVRGMLQHKSPVVRVNALEVLVNRTRHDEGLIEALVIAASNPANSVRLFGNTSVAHVAVGLLMQVGTPDAMNAAKSLVRAWPEHDQTDLIWYLKSAGLECRV